MTSQGKTRASTAVCCLEVGTGPGKLTEWKDACDDARLGVCRKSRMQLRQSTGCLPFTWTQSTHNDALRWLHQALPHMLPYCYLNTFHYLISSK